MRRLGIALVLGTLGVVACAAPDDAEPPMTQEPSEVVLGPVDGHELSPTDIERVEVGATAPDFTLAALDGPPVTLSGLRDEKNVVLVFYRGHW